MSSRPWSPPLDAHTRTTTTLSVVRARPEHLKAIHAIQLLAYPGRTDFHETEDVFRSKLEAYPAGNFVALATYSVVTDDDVSTWDKSPQLDEGVPQQEQVHDDDFTEEEEDQEHGKKKREEDGDLATSIRGVSVIDITETAPDGTTTAATVTTTADIPILRARTPDISEAGVDSEGDKAGSRLPAHKSSTRNAEESETQERHEDQDGEDMTTILFQWEQPVGYLFSHPYSRESVTLHRMSPIKDSRPAPPSEKKIRLDEDVDESGTDTETDSNDDVYNHDPLMEKYYIHDCAVHPDWRGRGLASKLWNALHESLTPHLDNGPSSTDKDLVDTEEEDEDEEVSGNTEGEHQQKPHHPHLHRHGHRRRNRGVHRRRGAPSLKEIVLVSVQGTRPFWERAGDFQVVTDHDMDLSVYGSDAFFMSAPFRL